MAASSVIGSSNQQSTQITRAESALNAAEQVVQRRETDLRIAERAVSSAENRADQRRQVLQQAQADHRIALAENLERGALLNITV